ncbi:MAG: hypothetical protein WBP64_19510 [Nitrososphaeraceae archaeon]
MTETIYNALLEKIIPSFIVISGTNHIFVRIDSTGFRVTHHHNTIRIEESRGDKKICEIIYLS